MFLDIKLCRWGRPFRTFRSIRVPSFGSVFIVNMNELWSSQRRDVFPHRVPDDLNARNKGLLNCVTSDTGVRMWAGWLSRYSDWLRAGRSGIESRWGRDFPPVQTGPGAHPTSCKMVTGSFPGVKCGRGVLLTTHPLLVPRSWKCTHLLGHTGPVTGSLYLYLFYWC